MRIAHRLAIFAAGFNAAFGFRAWLDGNDTDLAMYAAFALLATKWAALITDHARLEGRSW